MSSPCRTTSLLVSKESNGRIAYNYRDKEDSLSLKMGEQTFCISFFLSSSLRFPFLFAFLSFFFFSHFSSHLSFTFSSFSLLLWSFSLPFWSNHSFGQKEEISSPFPLTICVALIFPPLFLISLFPFYDIINHMVQYGPWNFFSYTWLIVSHSFKWTTWLSQVSLS